MKKEYKVSLSVFIFVLIAAVLLTFMVSFIFADASARSYYRNLVESSVFGEYDFQKLSAVVEYYNKYYLKDIDLGKAELAMIDAFITATGDRYGDYMTEDEFSQFISEMRGNLVGIGILVAFDQEKNEIVVINVNKDSPAEKGGMMPNDKIVSVGEISLSEDGYNAVVNAIRGESGSEVTVTVNRNGSEIDLKMTRAQVASQTVLYELLDDGKTGLVKILQFDGLTFSQFKDAMNALKTIGATQYVFDLRDNPGGELQSVCNVLDFLLPKGTIVRITDASGNVETIESDEAEFNAPMAILTNGNTASAAELFTSALKDYNKAFSVGTLTYGKGSMQQIAQLAVGGGIRITYRMYSPPISDNYDGIGISPEYEVELPEKYAQTSIFLIPKSEDTQLKCAVDNLNNN